MGGDNLHDVLEPNVVRKTYIQSFVLLETRDMSEGGPSTTNACSVRVVLCGRLREATGCFTLPTTAVSATVHMRVNSTDLRESISLVPATR